MVGFYYPTTRFIGIDTSIVKARSLSFKRLTIKLLLCLMLILGLSTSLIGQPEMVDFADPLSTGNTTGHIATLSVENSTSSNKVLLPATYYIPAFEDYQSYVVRITSQTVLTPNETTNISIMGYCVDIHSPAVPAGAKMLPMDQWIQVGDADKPDPTGLDITPSDVYKIPTEKIVDAYSANTFSQITGSSAFKSGDQSTESEVGLTFPGSGQKLNGTIKRKGNELTVAPLIVAYVGAINVATDEVQDSKLFTTPFSSDMDKEKQSINQQTIWVAMGLLDGQVYDIGQFSSKIFEQSSNSDEQSEEMSNEMKDKLEPGIKAFWDTFHATGLHAQIFSINTNEAGTALLDRVGSKVNRI